MSASKPSILSFMFRACEFRTLREKLLRLDRNGLDSEVLEDTIYFDPEKVHGPALHKVTGIYETSKFVSGHAFLISTWRVALEFRRCYQEQPR